MGSTFDMARALRLVRTVSLVIVATILCGTVLTCARKPSAVSTRKSRKAEPATASEANSAAMRLNGRGNRYFEIYECDSALACYREALALSEKFDLANRRYVTLSNIANTYDNRAHTQDRSKEQALADLDSAAASYTQLLEMVRAMNNEHQEARLLLNVAIFYHQSRLDAARADSLYTRAIALSERIGDPDVWTQAVYGRGFARGDMFHLEDARRDFATVLKAGRDRRVGTTRDVAWAEYYVELLDTLIAEKRKLSTEEWKQVMEHRRVDFRDISRAVKRLNIAEPSGFGQEKDER
jgi:tetratricopeptide (TPR) repeat protein